MKKPTREKASPLDPFTTLLANESNSVILSGTSKKVRMNTCIACFPCFEATKKQAIQAIRTSERGVPADLRICVIRQQSPSRVGFLSCSRLRSRRNSFG